MQKQKIGIIQVSISLLTIIFTIFFITSLVLALRYQSSLLEKYNVKNYDELVKLINPMENKYLKKLSNSFLASLIIFLCILLVSIAINIMVAYEFWKLKDQKIFLLSLGGILAIRLLSLISGSLLIHESLKKMKEKTQNTME